MLGVGLTRPRAHVRAAAREVADLHSGGNRPAARAVGAQRLVETAKPWQRAQERQRADHRAALRIARQSSRRTVAATPRGRGRGFDRVDERARGTPRSIVAVVRRRASRDVALRPLADELVVEGQHGAQERGGLVFQLRQRVVMDEVRQIAQDAGTSLDVGVFRVHGHVEELDELDVQLRLVRERNQRVDRFHHHGIANRVPETRTAGGAHKDQNARPTTAGRHLENGHARTGCARRTR